MTAAGDPNAVATARPRLLLIEDDDGIRRSLQLLLQGQGYDVRSFASATPALADPVSAEAQCLVIDYMLTDSDGVAVLRTLRERGWSGVAVLITAFASTEVREAARNAGFSAVLDKPFRDNELVNALAL